MLKRAILIVISLMFMGLHYLKENYIPRYQAAY